MSYKLTLNGASYVPFEWQQTELTAGWTDDFYSVTGNASFTFDGEAYAYLRSLYEVNYCDVVNCRLYLDDTLTHQGFIYLSEAEWNLTRCTVNVSVSDNGYFAIIKNKERQKYYLGAGVDSSNESITPVSADDIDFHIVTTGASDGTRACYRVFESFEYIVKAITDNEFEFESDFFDTGLGKDLYLTTGLEIRDPQPYAGNVSPNVSWSGLWDAFRKLYNLRGAIEVSGSTKTVRIEPYDYFRLPNESVFIQEVREVIEFNDTETLFSTIDAGSSDFSAFSTTTPQTSYPNVGLVTWDRQTYPVIGSCVTENTLGLEISDLVIDSNSIEAALLGDEDFDTEIFIIETDGTAATKYDTFGDGKSYYNQGLNNQEVIGRWSNRIHNSTIFNNGNLFGDFKASLSSDAALPISVGPFLDFDNEISDPGGDYNPTLGTGTYTLPVDGTYLFRVQVDLEITWTGPGPVFVEYYLFLIINGTDSADFRVKQLFNPNVLTTFDEVTTLRYTDNYTFGYVGEAGQEMSLRLFSFLPYSGVTVLSTTQWEASTAIFGDSANIIRRIEAPICQADFRAITDGYRQPVNVQSVKIYPRTITYRPFGLSEIEGEFTRNA